MSSTRALWFVVGSAVLAAIALGVALVLTRPSEESAASEHFHGNTPERAAESFIEAYRSGALERAAHFATTELAQTLRAEPPQEQASIEHESLLVQESHRLDEQRLRLSGVLVQEGQAESAGRNVSLTLHKQNGRYLVEEITW